jgi:hypothetical protein
MALRLYPFRQYAETDVINLFSSTTADTDQSTNGDGSAGVFVKVSAGNLDQDVVGLASNSYVGKTDYPFVGASYYPSVPLKFTVATNTAPVLGVTLNQTLLQDENGEKLLYYPQKRTEMQAVLTGQACPVLVRGIVTLADTAISWLDSTMTPGNRLVIGNTAGKVSGIASTTSGSFIVGSILATGTRTSSNVKSDYFVGTGVGKYAMVYIDCSASVYKGI